MNALVAIIPTSFNFHSLTKSQILINFSSTVSANAVVPSQIWIYGKYITAKTENQFPKFRINLQ